MISGDKTYDFRYFKNQDFVKKRYFSTFKSIFTHLDVTFSPNSGDQKDSPGPEDSKNICRFVIGRKKQY